MTIKNTFSIVIFYSDCMIFFFFCLFCILARQRRPPAAFLLNGAITRPATGSITFGQPFPSYMQSFIKIGVLVLEKSGNKIMTLCNFNKDVIPY